MSQALEALLDILALEPLGSHNFRGLSEHPDSERIYGGQVLAQAMIAADQTVEDDATAHSLHAYFLRAGDPAVPIDFEVDPIRDGRSFTTRRVVARQGTRAIFNLSASYHRPERGFEHQIDSPAVPAPEELESEVEFMRERLPQMPEAQRAWFEGERAVEIRPVEPIDPLAPTKREPIYRIWFRANGELPDHPAVHQAFLAYASDWSLIDTCTLPLGIGFLTGALQVASLDHAIWFHRPFRCDDWLLYDQDSPSASGGRAFARGCIYDRSGTLIASVTQEGLLRVTDESRRPTPIDA